ncbi:MAG TPA: VWA domain-containing protein [Acidimicrobiia bacterium]|nr:VWA domain-containing protein [Acidimicrobiia bacterium]
MPDLRHEDVAAGFRKLFGDNAGSATAAGHARAGMLDVLQGFIHELRAAGLPVSMTENLDAMRAIEHIPMGDRAAFRAALGATLVKHHGHWPAFETVFDVYFSLRSAQWGDIEGEAKLIDPDVLEQMQAADGGAMGDMSREELAELLLQALMSMDAEQLRRLAAEAVTRYAGMEPGRPVGGTYYLYRTLRQLDFDGMLDRMLERAQNEDGAPANDLDERLQRDEMQERLQRLKREVEEEIRRRLVGDRGVDAMARTLRRPLPEDVDFMHASRAEMATLQRSIYPLTRALQARLAQRRKRRHRGSLDFRKTVRASLSYGGVPVEPKFRHPHPSKPEIMVVADISGSVASFARFTLMFVYAMSSQFSKVRSWVFIDGVDEVTRFFDEAGDVQEAVYRVNTEADVVWVDGHSDYGHAFEVFHDRHLNEISPKTSIIILGDARNNYHAAQAWTLKELNKRARHLYWLNPEPRSYWDTGDSILSEYTPHCDGVYECRNLRQLEGFVSDVVVNR